MTSPLATEDAPFGRVLTAMVTPFTEDGGLDLASAQRLATHLVDSGNDGIVVSGTTGEAPTTSGHEDARLLNAVLDAVGDRATVIAGVGTNDTRHSVELTENAVDLGAHGLLLVTPYYSKPPQAGIVAHFDAVIAAAGDTPVLAYDIPGRTGVEIAKDTYRALAERPTVKAVKDAVGDIERGTWIRENTGLAVYSGDDPLNVDWLLSGAAGVVSVIGHVVAAQLKAMVQAVDAGDADAARQIQAGLEPVIEAIMGQTQGAIAAKAAVHALGLIASPKVRLPLVQATAAQLAVIRSAVGA